MRVCKTCGKKKRAEAFHRSAGSPDGRRAHCKQCRAAGRIHYVRPHMATPAARRAARLRIYGLTLEEYEAMRERQGGVCAICERKPTANRSLAVDHDHETGAVRGLLCVNCNQALGMLQDSPDVLAAAAMYLLRHENVLEAIT